MRAAVVEVDAERGRVERTLWLPFRAEWHSGPNADDEATRAAWLPQGVLVQPTHTAIHYVCPQSWSVLESWSHPRLHNVHSAIPRASGGVVVSCAGSDEVLCFDAADRLERTWSIAGHRPESDLRTFHHDAFKPHAAHPNCAWEHKGELWATCFERQAAISETGAVVPATGIPHDGAPQADGGWWFTEVQGVVRCHAPESATATVRWDLQQQAASPQRLGWCRGIWVGPETVVVGMSQLRATTHREVARWLLQGERGRKRPTRLVELDRQTGAIRREIPVGNAHGGTIYGVVACP